MKHLYAIGDIHGTFDKLDRLIKKIAPEPESDTVIFLGDYIDRGGFSYEVIDYLLRYKQQNRNAVFLKGNHEDMLERYLNGYDRELYIANGGNKTLDSYSRYRVHGDPLFPPNHLEFLNSLEYYYITTDYVFVHAGLRPGIPLEKQEKYDFLWIREDFILSDYDFGKKVIFGHTPFLKPFVEKNKIGVDTGAVFGNFLTCLKLPEEEFISV